MISREAFYTKQGEEIIADGFSGSLHRFAAAFANSNSLSNEDVDMLRKLTFFLHGERKMKLLF